MFKMPWANTRPAPLDEATTVMGGTDTPSGFAPSSLPMQTDEVREISGEVGVLITGLLKRYKCSVLHVDFRRRLSSKQYRAYITVGSRIGLDALYEIEEYLREKINDAQNIEIAGFYWKYRPMAEERT